MKEMERLLHDILTDNYLTGPNAELAENLLKEANYKGD